MLDSAALSHGCPYADLSPALIPSFCPQVEGQMLVGQALWPEYAASALCQLSHHCAGLSPLTQGSNGA